MRILAIILLATGLQATAQVVSVEVDGRLVDFSFQEDSTGVQLDGQTFTVMVGLLQSLAGSVAACQRLDALNGIQDSLRAREVATLQAIIATERQRTQLFQGAYEDAVDVGRDYRELGLRTEQIARRRGRQGFWAGLGAGVVATALAALALTR